MRGKVKLLHIRQGPQEEASNSLCAVLCYLHGRKWTGVVSRHYDFIADEYARVAP